MIILENMENKVCNIIYVKMYVINTIFYLYELNA